MRFVLRPYQQNAVALARERLASGKRACLIVAPTGSGKTIIACDILERATARQSRTLFLAHRKELIDQCSAKLSDIGIAHGIIKAGHSAAPERLCQIASVQTIARRPALQTGYQLIIVDECHHAPAGSYRKVLAANPEARVLGLTATPYRQDGKSLGDVFDTMIEVAAIEELTRQGFLVPVRVFAGPPVNLNGVRTTAGDYNQSDLGVAVNTTRLVGHIVKSWKNIASDRLTIGFATTVAHSKAIVESFQAWGVRAEHLDGSMPDDQREAVLARFRSRETQIVVNCMVLTEGFDCPEAGALILARPTKSRCLWRQMCGRTLRPAPGKVDCLILDHANCTDRHGFLTDPDRVSLAKGHNANERPPTERRCPECAAEFSGRPRRCPACGVELESASGARLDVDLGDERELAEIKSRNAMNEAVRRAAARYHQDLSLARRIGKEPNFAAFRYKAVTGHWPSSRLRMTAPVATVWKQTEDGKNILAWA